MAPYEIRNETEVWHKKDGKWSLKQKAKTAASAKATLRLLYGIESGAITAGNEGRMEKIKGK